MLNERGVGIKIEKPEEQQIAELKKELFDRECPKEYEPLIAGVHLIEIKEPYAGNLRSKFEEKEIAELIRNKFKDEKILDLGCGQTSDMWSLARNNRANLYIGVDLSPAVEPDYVEIVENAKEPPASLINISLSMPKDGWVAIDHPRDGEYKPKKINEPKFRLSKESSTVETFQITDDMLHAISRFKDNSIGVIIMSGIESLDLDSEVGKVNDEYLKTLQAEIKRVLRHGGILINYYSDILAGGLSSIAHGAGDDLHIFEKK